MKHLKQLNIILISLFAIFLIFSGCGGDNQHSERGGFPAPSEHLAPVDQTKPEEPAPAPAPQPPTPTPSVSPTAEPIPEPDSEPDIDEPVEPSEEVTEPEEDLPPASITRPPRDNPLVGNWVRVDSRGRTQSVEFFADGRWIRTYPRGEQTHGTYEMKQKTVLVIKEDEPRDFHESGLLTTYNIVKEDGKTLLGIRGFIGSDPVYEKQTD